MRAKAVINRIQLICNRKGIDPKDMNISFNGIDIDGLWEYDNDTNTLILHHSEFLKEGEIV